jgi:hypothetical protein
MRAGIALVCTIILLPAVHAAATPYLVAYEGDVYPEEAAWERITTDGGVERSLENGVLTLHDPNPAPYGGSDQYNYYMNEQLDPSWEELFFVDWRVRILADPWGGDPKVFIAPDGMQRAFTGLLSTSYFGSPPN